ncbi:cystatin-B-like [Dendronephthya gigantea]|uniref:cystatin-B-like n=1 Tax=Dendronephthya gigantea TaxID=151771 RepID=UPI001069E2E0|nr:cystatin-B-like [Dendronephthya gigantea]
MPLKYSDIEWNGQPVVWYIVCRNIDLASGKDSETPSVHDADEEVQEMCDDFKDEVARRIKTRIDDIQAETFAVQVVHSGIHFYIKASISSKQCVHLRIHRPFSYRGEESTLEAVLANQGPQKALNYF